MFADGVPDALAAVDALQEVACDIRRQLPGWIFISIWQNCAVTTTTPGWCFAAYVPGCGQALANGGRYNDVGAVFGRARPATGFATDLKALLTMVPASSAGGGSAISMPDADDPALDAAGA